MPAPLIAGAAAVAARLVAKKVAGNAVKKAVANKAASVAQKKAYKEKVTIPAKKVVKAAKAEAKSNARGLKAANKPVKSKDADLINRNNPYARQAILSEKPARANRTRLGKDAFKSK